LKILIIQTAFIGDVVLATGILEKLHSFYPEARIDFLLRKGNEGLLQDHPFISELLVWDKNQSKYAHLWQLLKRTRKSRYDVVINLQRFTASGLLTVFSGAKKTLGFRKNPLSFAFTEAFPHELGKKGDLHFQHEVQRNHELIRSMTDEQWAKPRLYPSTEDFKSIDKYTLSPFLTVSPASVWFTKQFREEQWTEFIARLGDRFPVFLLGGKGDEELCNRIAQASGMKNVHTLAGKLGFLQTSALMSRAVMNYTNDSAPMHFASAMNAPVTAVFCSTIPEFGFGPLSDKSYIVEIKEELDCRPCGLHGYRACPLGHFNCAKQVETRQLLQVLES
jgi:heptosyltransferase-2